MNTVPRGYRRLTMDGFSHYAINKRGDVINLITGDTLTIRTNKSHWSGAVKLHGLYGNVRCFNREFLIRKMYSRVTRSELEALRVN